MSYLLARNWPGDHYVWEQNNTQPSHLPAEGHPAPSPRPLSALCPALGLGPHPLSLLSSTWQHFLLKMFFTVSNSTPTEETHTHRMKHYEMNAWTTLLQSTRAARPREGEVPARCTCRQVSDPWDRRAPPGLVSISSSQECDCLWAKPLHTHSLAAALAHPALPHLGPQLWPQSLPGQSFSSFPVQRATVLVKLLL